MQINLKQGDIIKALNMYITGLGISLRNKNVDVKFTAGRGETGLSAEIIIEDGTSMPDFGSDVVDDTNAGIAAKPALALVANTGATTAEATGMKTADPGAKPLAEPELPSPAEGETPAPVKTASLFN